MIPAKTVDAKAARILAKSLYRELRGNGYTPKQILSLSTELIDLVTQDLKANPDELEADLVNGNGVEKDWREAI
jgi:hypothetical protein